jgi:hypothetical protein
MIDTIKNAINEALGTAPAYWAPGVTPLGWSFKIEPSKVIVNSALEFKYKQRTVKGLEQLFEAKKMAVEIVVGV